MANKNNPGIIKTDSPIEYTKHMIEEMQRCVVDPVYFIKNYVYIKHPKRGKIIFNMYPFQEEMVRKYHKQDFSITLASRQCGKTETTVAFLLHYAIFNFDKTILIASNKSSNAMQIIERIQYAYEELPAWLKPSIDLNNWNKHTCGFSNKSIIVSTTTSKNSGRGLPISVVYCLKGDSSFVTIRNKNTGEISNMSLVDLFEQLD